MTAVYTDNGVSGAKGHDKRPGFRCALQEYGIRELRSTGMGILKIARQLGVGVSVVQRVVA